MKNNMKAVVVLKVCLPILLLLSTIGYIVSVINSVPLGDEWRWMKNLLIPYEYGNINLWEYVTGEYAFLSHSHYFTLLFIYFDYQVFGLDYAHMSYFGLGMYIACWCLLAWYFLLLHDYKLNFVGYLCFLIFTVAYASPLSNFSWGLVLFEYLYFFFALALLCFFDLTLRSKLSLKAFFPAFVFSAIFADTIGLVAVLTVLGWCLLASLLKRYSWKNTLILWSCFLLVLIVQFAILGSGIGGGSDPFGALIGLLGSVEHIFQSLLMTFALPLMDKTMLSESEVFQEGFRVWQLVVGFLGMIVSLVGVGCYLALGGARRSQLPMLLFLFGLVSWAAILLTRYQDFGPYIFDGRRFVRFFTTYYIAAGFGLSLCLKGPRKVVTCALLVLMASFFWVASVAQYHRAKYVQSYFEVAASALQADPLDSKQLGGSIPRCRNHFCDEVIEFLRNEKSNAIR